MKTRTQLKSYFEFDDLPTAGEFSELIDSIPNITDDLVGYESKVYVTDVVVSGIQQVIPVLALAGNAFHYEAIDLVILSVTGSTIDQSKYITIGNIFSVDYSTLINASPSDMLTQSGEPHLQTPDVEIVADGFPSGITGLMIRVIIKGFIVPIP